MQSSMCAIQQASNSLANTVSDSLKDKSLDKSFFLNAFTSFGSHDLQIKFYSWSCLQYNNNNEYKENIQTMTIVNVEPGWPAAHS